MGVWSQHVTSQLMSEHSKRWSRSQRYRLTALSAAWIQCMCCGFRCSVPPLTAPEPQRGKAQRGPERYPRGAHRPPAGFCRRPLNLRSFEDWNEDICIPAELFILCSAPSLGLGAAELYSEPNVRVYIIIHEARLRHYSRTTAFRNQVTTSDTVQRHAMKAKHCFHRRSLRSIVSGVVSRVLAVVPCST